MASLCCILLLSVISIFFLLAADGLTVPQHSDDYSKVKMMFSNYSTKPNAPTKTPPSDLLDNQKQNPEELREGAIEKLEKAKARRKANTRRKAKIEAYKVVVTHYLLVLQWPPSVCKSVKNTDKNCNTPIPQDFKIHGLWPQGEEGNLVRCVPNKANEFNSGEVFKVKNLTKVWPQLFIGNTGNPNPNLETVNFWKHEWEKHGVCSGLNPVDYFEKAVNLYYKLKLKDQLGEIGVQPGKMYAPQPGIIDWLPLHLTPKVTCGANSTGQFEIQEFSFNVTATADNFQPITIANKVSDCPNRGNNPVGFRQ